MNAIMDSGHIGGGGKIDTTWRRTMARRLRKRKFDGKGGSREVIWKVWKRRRRRNVWRSQRR